MSEFTEILLRVSRGEERAADALTPLLYDELRDHVRGVLAQRPRPVSLDATDIVHEVYLRLVDQTRATYRDRMHFLAVASMVTRRVLIDHVRRQAAAKRGGDGDSLTLDSHVLGDENSSFDVLAVHEALSKLEQEDPRAARLVELRFFGGLTVPEAAEILEISEPSAHRWWRFARAYLYKLLQDG